MRIGGPGVARGYLGLPALTAERFVSDAVGPIRWYLTGDLASRADDGTFSFHGRGDQQVKLNGFRIELGELESTLEMHPSVAQCVAAVVDDPRGEPCLVAWCVPAADAALDVVALRSLAAGRLPGAMVPRTVVAVSGFVLTPTGKADRSKLRYPPAESFAALPAADQRADDLDALVVDFATVVERAVRPDDDFFDLGGHSLSAAWLATLIFDRTGLRMPLRAVVESPTPRLLAQRLDVLSHDVDGIGSGAQVLVRFGPRRAVPQLYVVHGAGGNVIGFHDLAESLADVADVIGVQAIGVEPGNSLDETVEAMAARYVEAIRADRTDHGSLPGPVLLGGYSGGGRVALCMAAHLLHEGVEVGPVALIDTFVSEQLPGTRAGRTAAVMASALDRGPHTRRQWARSSFAAWRRRREADVPVDSPEQVARYVDLEEAIDRATMAAPPPQPVSCGAFLIRAQYTNPVFRLDYRWDPHLHAAVPVAWVPGGHLTLLQRPAVDHVADAIRNGMRTWLSGSPRGAAVTPR